MGTLKPGSTLRYESDSEGIYAVDIETNERLLVGYNYQRDPLDHRNYKSDPKESQLWHDIRQAALTDKNLQEALERVKIMYYLTHDKQDVVQHHPV
jgi:hypothetical protein